MRAVKAGRVFVADGNLFFNRSGPRVVESAEMLAEMFWPELLGLFGHHGNGFATLAGAFAKMEASAQSLPPPSKISAGPSTLHVLCHRRVCFEPPVQSLNSHGCAFARAQECHHFLAA
jgi:hypothetical protein